MRRSPQVIIAFLFAILSQSSGGPAMAGQLLGNLFGGGGDKKGDQQHQNAGQDSTCCGQFMSVGSPPPWMMSYFPTPPGLNEDQANRWNEFKLQNAMRPANPANPGS